uniref:Uncharacterized protein n=1 Tax=Candidatus Kentrum sp. TC TaxID=2126339 RepID=A0A450ZS98_9GAMM|nr:MAG: hypothetical protein BECKTC1821F_GA0114240_101137 [Candidatus Kentron sp. TC]
MAHGWVDFSFRDIEGDAFEEGFPLGGGRGMEILRMPCGCFGNPAT